MARELEARRNYQIGFLSDIDVAIHALHTVQVISAVVGYLMLVTYPMGSEHA